MHRFINSAGMNRGGSFVAAPVFGPVPNKPAWAGVNLRQHGLIRLVSDEDWQSEEKHTPGEDRYEFQTNLGGTPEYPWQFAVRVSYVYQEKSEMVTMQVSVTRRNTCLVTRPMPLSLGFHPYFATHGERAIIWHDDQPIEVDDNLLQARYVPIGVHGTKLETEYGFVNFDRHFGVEGFLFWTDDHKRYVCIEPVCGFESPKFLLPNEGISVMVTMTWQSKKTKMV